MGFKNVSQKGNSTVAGKKTAQRESTLAHSALNKAAVHKPVPGKGGKGENNGSGGSNK